MTDPARAPVDVPVPQGFEGMPEELRDPFGPAYCSAGGSSSSSIDQRSSHSLGHRSVRSATLPWWPAAEHVGHSQTAAVYHSTTQLPDGRLSVIIGPGAWTNLMGENLARKLSQRAMACGHKPR